MLVFFRYGCVAPLQMWNYIKESIPIVSHISDDNRSANFPTSRYIVAAQALVDEARGTLSERGWRTRNNEAASYDDISVFVVPLGRHEDIASYVNAKKQDSKLYRDGSFARKYVNRDEVEIQTRNALADKSNANNAEQLTNDRNEDGSEETPSTATEKTLEDSSSELNS